MQDLHLQGGTCLPVSSIVGVIHQNAGPWRRAAAKAQDGLMGFVRIPCFAGTAATRQPTHPKGKGSLHSQSPAAPYSTAISDSQQFERCFAPPNCVRCCDCSSLRTANAVPQSPAR